MVAGARVEGDRAALTPTRDPPVMWLPFLTTILLRDLETLEREVAAYPDDAAVWRVAPGIANSAGTLVLHLCGGLRHFVGARLGQSGYRRDRTEEFGARDVDRDRLRRLIRRTREEIGDALATLNPEVLASDYPDTPGGCRLTTADFLLHLVAHTGYHLGQVDYHRRLLTGDGTTAAAMALSRLASARPPAPG